MASEVKRELFYTPRGVADYPYLVKPDMGSEGFRNTKGVYKIGLKLDPENNEEHANFIAAIEEENRAYHTALAKKDPKKKHMCADPRMPFKAEIDPDSGDPTGLIIVKFKSYHRPRLWDAARQPILGEPNIGNGSEVKISFTKNFYFMATDSTVGMNLYLNAVQVLKLVEYTGGDAPDGFAEEEGYQADQPPAFDGDDDKGDGAPPAKPKGKAQAKPEDDDDIPFDHPPKVKAGAKKEAEADDPRLVMIDAAIAGDPTLGELCKKAKLGYDELLVIWEDTKPKGNSAMFKIKVRGVIKQKGVK